MNTGRILVVDDEHSTRFMLNDYFTSVGYEVEEANNGEDALKKFTPGKFDCVISDLFMPSIDGMELLKRIKNLDTAVSFLMITAHPRLDSAIGAIKEGAQDYLTKPFNMDEIQLKVERAVHIKRTEAILKKVKSYFLGLIIMMPILISVGIVLGILLNGK